MIWWVEFETVTDPDHSFIKTTDLEYLLAPWHGEKEQASSFHV